MGALVSHIGGYGIPAIPTQPATAMFSHRFHGFTQMVRLRSGLPQNSQISQKFIAEKKLPQISRIYTLSLQKNTTQSHKLQNDQGKTMIAKDSFVPLL